MFGKKDAKQSRLEKIADAVRNAIGGITQAELARKANVTRSTLTKDMGIIERATNTLFYEDEGRLYWFDKNDRGE